MKTKLLTTFTIAILGLSNFSNAQSPWLWAKSGGSTDVDEAYSVSADAAGNSYVTGRFASASIIFGTTTLTNSGTAGTMDIFIVKYDGLGNVVWAKSAGGSSRDEANSISTDVLGNVLVVGHFQSSSITFGTTTLTNSGNSDLFIVKYDGLGNVLWAKKAGGNSGDEANAVTTDASNNVYVTGFFGSSSIVFGSTTLTNVGLANIFIAKYTASGNPIWAKSTGGSNIDWGNSVSADASGNIYVAGHFGSSSMTIGTTTLTNSNPGWWNMFVAKYDTAGTSIWAKSAGGTGIDDATGVTSDASGNVYVAGNFDSPSILFGSTTLTNAGTTNDIFFVKYDVSGNIQWAKSAGGSQNDGAFGIANDASGNIYMTGVFRGASVTFGTTTLTNTSSSTADIYVVKYNPAGSGTLIWAQSVGGSSEDISYSISTDASANVYVAGYFISSSITFGSTTLTTAGNYDMYVAKLSGTTGINDVIFSNNISIFPNPFSSQTTLQTDNLLKDATLTVYNSFGQTVTQIKNISGQAITISRDNLPSGVYFVRLTQNSKLIATGKLVITD